MYTDGSCHTQSLTGAWVALLFIGHQKIPLSGLEEGTTHNRMELTAVIKAIEFLKDNYAGISNITIYSDSQYVTGLHARKARLTALDFCSKKGKPLQNTDLVKKLLDLCELYKIEMIKVKAHQKNNGVNEFNIEADLLCRKMVRQAIRR